MNIDEFLSLVSTLEGWRLDERGHIFRNCPTRECPITAVANQTPGTHYSIAGFDLAGLEIGLTREDARRIAIAADNNVDYSEFDPELRARLRAAAQLEVRS